jgi:hypothetical protein
MDREPISYTLYFGLDANIHELWEEYGVYESYTLAVRDIELLINQWRVKIEYLFPNGIIEFRIVEGGKGHYVTIPTPPPAPTPAPTPEPPPAPEPPPPGFEHSLDFTTEENSMYTSIL